MNFWKLMVEFWRSHKEIQKAIDFWHRDILRSFMIVYTVIASCHIHTPIVLLYKHLNDYLFMAFVHVVYIHLS